MKRRVIHIDQDKCNGCGACATACHEGAIGMVNGKARLMRDNYCDGLGDCLPACPTNAITFVEREAAPYDEAAVKANKAAIAAAKANTQTAACTAAVSRLQQWPVQIKLALVNAPYFDGCDLLIASDCTAYAYAGFHEQFMKERVTLIGCPKLDAIDYSEKLTEILRNNDIRSITLTRMEVPCCGGMTYAVQRAIANSGKDIPLKVTVISINGEILN